MNKLRILIIGAGLSLLFSLIKGIVYAMPGRSRASAKKRLEQADWLDSDAKDGAFVKTTGKVMTREATERVVSPLADVRGVAMLLRAYVRRGRGPRGEMIEKLQLRPFVIEDDGQKVLVEATHALLDLGPTPPPKTADPHKLFAELGIDAPAGTPCDETVVPVGATVTVAGKLVLSPIIKLVGDEANPIVIRAERARVLANEP